MHIGRTTIVLQHYPAGIADGGQQCRSRESTPRRVSSKYLGRQFFSSDFIGPVGAVAESCEGGRHIVEFGGNLIYIEMFEGVLVSSLTNYEISQHDAVERGDAVQ